MFYSSRGDGLGERLCAIFNSLFLAELVSGKSAFHWPTPFKSIASNFHSVEPVEEVFSAEFIKAYHLQEPLLAKSISKLNFNDIKSIKQLSKSIDAEHIFDVPQYSLMKSINELLIEHPELIKNTVNKIQFAEPISKVQYLMNVVRLPKACVAIHIRTGDIVYGKYSNQPHYFRKVLTAPIAKFIIDQLVEQGYTVLLCGQESIATKAFANGKTVFCADEFYQYLNLSKLQIAFADIFLMAKAKSIIAGNSGFSRFAANLNGRITRHPNFYFDSKINIQQTIEIFDGCIKTCGKPQVAYSAFLLFQYLSEKSPEFHKSQSALQLLDYAQKIDSENKMYEILLSFYYSNIGKFNLAEQRLKTILTIDDLSKDDRDATETITNVLSTTVPGAKKLMYSDYIDIPKLESISDYPVLNKIANFFLINNNESLTDQPFYPKSE